MKCGVGETLGHFIVCMPDCCWLHVRMHPGGPATDRPTDRLSGHRLVFFVALCVEAQMAATLQVASACFSGSPPNSFPFVESKKTPWP